MKQKMSGPTLLIIFLLTFQIGLAVSARRQPVKPPDMVLTIPADTLKVGVPYYFSFKVGTTPESIAIMPLAGHTSVRVLGPQHATVNPAYAAIQRYFVLGGAAR